MIKKLVCFANSRKIGGKCFAGKDINDNNGIRPISYRPNESLNNIEECICGNNCRCFICNPQIPNLLDVVEIEFDKYVGEGHQIENYLVSGSKWRKIGVLKNKFIDNYLDKHKDPLWVDGYSTGNRKNDRIPVSMSYKLHKSLCLIEVQAIKFLVTVEGKEYGNPRKKVNGKFIYNNTEYIIPVTDEVIENYYLSFNEGIYQPDYKENRIILCLSTGKEYQGYIYKFIAGVMII